MTAFTLDNDNVEDVADACDLREMVGYLVFQNRRLLWTTVHSAPVNIDRGENAQIIKPQSS
jgi:hypothetical protein